MVSDVCKEGYLQFRYMLIVIVLLSYSFGRGFLFCAALVDIRLLYPRICSVVEVISRLVRRIICIPIISIGMIIGPFYVC